MSGTHRVRFLKAHGLEDKSYSLKELSSISKVPMKILNEVYKRGIGAYKTQPNSVRLKGSFVKGVKAPMSAKLSKEQWAMARVYSFLDGNKKHDNDLRGGNTMTASAPPPPPPPRKGKKCDVPASADQKNLIKEYNKIKRQRDMMETNRQATINMMGEEEWVGSIGEQRLNALNARLAVLENAMRNAHQLKKGCGNSPSKVAPAPEKLEAFTDDETTGDRADTEDSMGRANTEDRNADAGDVVSEDEAEEEPLPAPLRPGQARAFAPQMGAIAQSEADTQRSIEAYTRMMELQRVRQNLAGVELQRDMDMRWTGKYAPTPQQLARYEQRIAELKAEIKRLGGNGRYRGKGRTEDLAQLKKLYNKVKRGMEADLNGRLLGWRRQKGIDKITKNMALIEALMKKVAKELTPEVIGQISEVINAPWIQAGTFILEQTTDKRKKEIFDSFEPDVSIDLLETMVKEAEAPTPDPPARAPPPTRPMTTEEARKEAYGYGKLHGCGRPDNNTFHQIAKETYNSKGRDSVNGWQLVYNTPTLKFYRKHNEVVIGIRGTSPTDVNDLSADASIPLNKLEGTTRFQRDLDAINRFQYRNGDLEYYGVGHSLGGAILDLLLRKGLVSSGVSYNPAVQPQDFKTKLANQRIYDKGDPLYNLGKNFLQDMPEVRDNSTWWSRLLGNSPVSYLNSHGLHNFEGGSGSKAETATRGNPKLERQLSKAGLDASSYLEEARRRAKIHHYPHKLLGFATDGIHKLAIPDENGRVVSFGRIGYGDHLIYTHMEKAGSVASGTADKKQSVFHKSHSKIKGDWKSNPFSANNLALKILW
jgi:hypothetical protein